MGKYEYSSGKNGPDNPWRFYPDRVGPRPLKSGTKIGLAFGALVTAAFGLFGQPTAHVPSAAPTGEAPVPHVLQLQSSPSQPTTFEPRMLLTSLVGSDDFPVPAEKTDVVSPTIKIQPSPAVRLYTEGGACSGSVVDIDNDKNPPQVLVVTASHCMNGGINTNGGSGEWIQYPGTIQYNPTGDLDKPGTITLEIDAMKRDPKGAGSHGCNEVRVGGSFCFNNDIAFVTASGVGAQLIPVQNIDQGPIAVGTTLTVTGFGGRTQAGTITATYGSPNIYGPGIDCVADSKVSAFTPGDSGSGLHGPDGIVGVTSAAVGTGNHDQYGQEIMMYPICAHTGGKNAAFVGGVMKAFETGSITTTAAYQYGPPYIPRIEQRGYTVSVTGPLPSGTVKATMRMEMPNVQKTGCEVRGVPEDGATQIVSTFTSDGPNVTQVITATGGAAGVMTFTLFGSGNCPYTMQVSGMEASYPNSSHGQRADVSMLPIRIQTPHTTQTMFPLLRTSPVTNEIGTAVEPGP